MRYVPVMALRATDILISIEDSLEGELVSKGSESLGGPVFEMNGEKIRHNKASGNTGRYLGNSLDGKPCNVFNSDNKIRVFRSNEIRHRHPVLDDKTIGQPSHISDLHTVGGLHRTLRNDFAWPKPGILN